MQTQPSAQGIASLYMGNPGALQQRIQKDQQAKPGLPPDLKQLMALNIVTNEEDAAKRQQAMNALNSMAPAGQEPPTVAQSIQEQAKQAMQARMLQAQRQQQGLQALAEQSPSMEVPEGVPQPEAQPQGIDELPVDMEFAGGGIVAFSDGKDVRGYETAYDRMNRENREQSERDRAERLARIEAEGGNTTSYGEQMRGLGRFIDQFVPDPVRIFRRLVSDPSLEREEAAAKPPVASYSNEGRRAPVVAGLPAAVDGRAIPASGARPVPGPRPTATAPADQAPPAAAPAQSLADLVAERERMAAASRDKEMERYGTLVPRPDTSQYDRLIAELEGRKRQFDAPKAGFDAFAEYMGQIAAAGPARTWMEAGARGAMGQQALNKERQAQQFELTKQAIDIAQKKIDADRAYNKELYATGEAAAKRTAEIAKDTAQEMGLNQRQTALLANQIKVQELQNKGMLASANARVAAGGGEDKQKLNELKALQTSLKDQLKDPRMMGPAGDPIRAQLARVNMAIAQMAGLDTMSAAPGAGSPGGNTRMRFDAQGNPIK